MRAGHRRRWRQVSRGQAWQRRRTEESSTGQSERSTEVRRRGVEDGGVTLATMGQPEEEDTGGR